MLGRNTFYQKFSLLVLVFIATGALELKSQDTLLKTKLKLFDIQFGVGLNQQSPPEITKNNVGDYTRHKEYTGSFLLN